MEARQSRRFAMLVRVRDFGDTYRERFPDATVAGQAFATIATAIGQLNANAVEKMATARGGRSTRKTARAALINRLDAIARTARAIAAQIPGFDDPFHPTRYPDRALLTAGQAFAAHAGPVKEQFIGLGLPETFVVELEALVETFEQAIRGCEARRGDRAAAGAGIGAALSSGLAAARTLDVVVTNQLHSDPVAIAVWQRARRIGHPRAKAVAAKPTLRAVAPPVPRGGNVARRVA